MEHVIFKHFDGKGTLMILIFMSQNFVFQGTMHSWKYGDFIKYLSFTMFKIVPKYNYTRFPCNKKKY